MTKYSLFGRRRKRTRLKNLIIPIILFPCAVFLIVFHLQWRPLHSSIHLASKLPNKSQSILDNIKNDIYQQCKTFSQRIYLSQSPLPNNHKTKTFQDVYLLIHYSPRKEDEGGLYLQIATSYLLSQNLQRLSRQQQIHTHLTIFLHENYTNVMYKRLKQWFESIFIPYTSTIDVLPLKNDNNQSLWKLMRNYIISNKNIHYDTILFFLQDDYIFEKEMLFDTIDFFISHEPCFIYQTDYSDRCGFDMTDGFGHLLVPGKTRLWRSISSTAISYACRLKTFLAFEDILMNTMNNLKLNQKIRAEVGGQDVFFCAIPSYSARIETLLLPDEVNITVNDDMAIYYKDWWSMARHALTEAQKKESFPCPKINERNLF